MVFPMALCVLQVGTSLQEGAEPVSYVRAACWWLGEWRCLWRGHAPLVLWLHAAAGQTGRARA